MAPLRICAWPDEIAAALRGRERERRPGFSIERVTLLKLRDLVDTPWLFRTVRVAMARGDRAQLEILGPSAPRNCAAPIGTAGSGHSINVALSVVSQPSEIVAHGFFRFCRVASFPPCSVGNHLGTIALA
jgi:hypothetical protein